MASIGIFNKKLHTCFTQTNEQFQDLRISSWICGFLSF